MDDYAKRFFREHSYINPVLLVSVFEGLILVVAYSFDARNGGGLGYPPFDVFYAMKSCFVFALD